MELTMMDAQTERTVSVRVDDGIVIRSAHDRDMVITRITISYTVELDRWVAWSALVSGYRLRQDGTVGLKEDEVLYSRPDQFPGWLTRAAEHYRPQGTATWDPVPTCVLDVKTEEK
jgi:hypothetical protein